MMTVNVGSGEIVLRMADILLEIVRSLEAVTDIVLEIGLVLVVDVVVGGVWMDNVERTVELGLNGGGIGVIVDVCGWTNL